jgi:PhnB protein
MKRKKAGNRTRRAATARTRRAPATPLRRPATDESGVAPGMQAISAYLAVANVQASIEFPEKTLGFSRGVTLADSDGQLRYAEMRHRDSVVVLVRKGDGTAATGGASALYTYVDDVDAALGQARQAGAAVDDAEDKPWGDRVATVKDPDGHRWVLATFKKLAPFS